MTHQLSTTRRPPGPRGSYLTGNLKAYEQDRLEFLLGIRDEYGGVAAFDTRTTVISDLDVVDRILRDPTGTFEVDQNVLGQHLDADQVASILALRAHLNPTLRPATLTRTALNVASLTSERLENVSTESFDPLLMGECVVAEAFSWHLFGPGQRPFLEQVKELLDSLEPRIGDVMTLPASWRSPRQRRVERRHHALRRELVDYLRRLPDRQLPASHQLEAGIAGRLAESTNGGHSTEQVADLLIGAMLAAQRVPAAGISWALIEVADHPELQPALRQEAARFRDHACSGLGTSAVQFPLALAAVTEALRLHPPTWLTTRTVLRATRVSGYEFERGHVFMISPYVLHRDPRLFTNPTDFNPHRWQDRTTTPQSFLAFGRGRHRCPGSDFATTALVAMLLTLQRNSSLARRGVYGVEVKNTLRPTGLKIVRTPAADTHDVFTSDIDSRPSTTETKPWRTVRT